MSRARTDEIAAAYDRWSEIYESMQNPTRDLAARVLRERFDRVPDADVLEIGCGTGLNTRFLADASRSVVALDFSAGMLAQARANVRVGNVRFERQDIRGRWNVADASADRVVCTLVLEHVADLDRVFGEMRRVLRAGGRVFVCELHPFRQLRGGQAQFMDAASGEVVRVPAHLHDASAYVNACLHHGFELTRLGEWRDDGAGATDTPRLLSLEACSPQRNG